MCNLVQSTGKLGMVLVSEYGTLMGLLMCCGRSAVTEAFGTSRLVVPSFWKAFRTSRLAVMRRTWKNVVREDSSVRYRYWSARNLTMDSAEKDVHVRLSSDEETWLVVGDGDLSYSASIAKHLEDSKIRLIASVFEERELHRRVYEHSEKNSDLISFHPRHTVLFGVDATNLKKRFPGARFNVIQFNFPHWRGKNNNRYNRELLANFLASAKAVLHTEDGEIHVALAEGQGGLPVSSLTEWKQSWMAAMYAAENQLLLCRLESFQPDYCLSSHRGVDRPFRIGDAPQRYIFRLPNGQPIDNDFQISCRNELRIMLHPELLEDCPVSLDDIVHGDAVFHLGKELIDDGISFEIPARHLLRPQIFNESHVPLAVFLLTYSGESNALTRNKADRIRAHIEASIVERWKLQIAKGGRMVSRPYPRNLTDQLIKEYKSLS